MEETSRYLLLLACSARKAAPSGVVRAIDLYDGVFYRVVRKARRDGYWSAALQVAIVSARYGLLEPEAEIASYDQRMTREQARALQQEVGAALDALLMQHRFAEVFINLGQCYLLAVAASRELPRLGARAHYATGGIGERMAQMKDWLLYIARKGGEPEGRG